MGKNRPVILGWDFSADIVEKAEGTIGFEIGNRVFGEMPSERGSAYAEYVAVPPNIIAHVPENMSYEDAAVTTMAAITAWNPLANDFPLRKGDTILIHAGAGGVGHFAIQIEKYLGARVITTASSKNRDFVLSLGADQHIDYTTQDFWEIAKNVDFVLDTIGEETLEHSIAAVKETGQDHHPYSCTGRETD